METLFYVPLKMNRMYIRGNGEKRGKRIVLEPGRYITTDTYFGCFPCEPYTEHTTIKDIRVIIELKGRGKIKLHCFTLAEDQVIHEFDFNEENETEIILTACLAEHTMGCLYVEVVAEKESEIISIRYEGEGEVRKTQITIIICSYKRDAFILRNLQLLSDTISEDDFLRESLDVICVDNGRTLTADISGVRLVQNRNFGGSGGYARGMMEADKCTHIWMMDDDIQFNPSILRRAVTFIRHRNNDEIRLAAGMFSFETPTIQNEATASFNGYTFISNGHGLDFKEKSALLNNRIEFPEHVYGGWWSLIMPATNELPMPFFIKIDDVEYALRKPGIFVIMNGFGVWHEAFGKKGNAWTEYYTTRNTLILQDIYPELPHSAVKMMAIRLLKALAYGEPKCMEAAFRGVEDYAAGAEKFREVNPEQRHREILEKFAVPLMSDMSRKKMLRYAAINIFRPHNWRSIGLFFKAVRRIDRRRKNSPWNQLNTVDFWQNYFRLN